MASVLYLRNESKATRHALSPLRHPKDHVNARMKAASVQATVESMSAGFSKVAPVNPKLTHWAQDGGLIKQIKLLKYQISITKVKLKKSWITPSTSMILADVQREYGLAL